MDGQLWPHERTILYHWITVAQPTTVLEIGTWKGGGSTLTIITALRNNNKGVMHTCEINPDYYTSAIKGHEGTQITETHYTTSDNRLHLYNWSSTELIQYLLAHNTIPNFIFQDGPEDPTHNLNDLITIEPHLPDKAIYVAHDWDLGPRADDQISIKSSLLRPYIESSPKWTILEYLTKPISVGLVIAQHHKAD